MLTSFPVLVAVGTALGFLAGLGVGGGSLLILWLTFVMGMEHADARGINLLFFLPTAASSLYCHRKNGYLDAPTMKSAVPPAIALALLGAWIATAIDVELLRKPFGVYLLFSGGSLIWPRRK